MMKKIVAVLIALMVLIAPLALAAQTEEATFNPEDFNGKKVAVLAGTIFDQVVQKAIPGAEVSYFSTLLDMVEAVREGQVSAMVSDDTVLMRCAINTPGLKILKPYLMEDKYGMITAKGNEALLNALDEFINEIMMDGTYQDMLDRWLYQKDPSPMPDIPEGKGELLRFGTTGTSDGFSFFMNGVPAGFDVEFAKRFAASQDRKLEIQTTDMSGLVPAVQSGKVDFGGCLLSITEERKKNVNFTDPYYTGGGAIAVYEAPQAAASVPFWVRLRESFVNNLIIEDRWKMIASGLWVTLQITLCAFALATVLGAIVCGLKMTRASLSRGIAGVYINVLRGTPIVVLLMILFHAVFIGKWAIDPIWVAVIAFGVNGGAFIGEIMRSAILTVDPGQVEAARSMGFTKSGTFLTVTLPQAAKTAMPVYVSEFISMLKGTAVVGYISIIDLTRAGDLIRARTYDSLFPLLVVAAVYLAATGVLVWGLGRINRLSDRRARRAKA